MGVRAAEEDAMDTFMDQLSQKLNAQEIIRANGTAESEAMAVMRTQVKEYRDCLDRMKGVAEELGGLEHQIKALTDRQTEQSDEAFESVKAQLRASDETISGLKKQLEQTAAESAGRLEEMTRDSADRMDRMQKELEEHFENGEEFHKEGVRIYRNVQAVVQEESAKQIQEAKDAVTPVLKQVKSVKAVAVCALIFAIAGVALQVLGILGIF